MSDATISLIREALFYIEQRESVNIVLASEAGSRAWGFASPDSDWDVRFIYVRPADHYLSVDEVRDVLDCNTSGFKDVLKGTRFDVPELDDLSGWDLRKALFQIRKSNPQILEWIGSPTVYRAAYPRIQELAREAFNPYPVIQHYHHMAKGNFREYLQADEVWYKKYLYVIRPLQAARYVYTFKEAAPVSFAELRSAVEDPSISHAVDVLLEVKMRSGEKKLHPRVPLLNDWIESELKLWSRTELPSHVQTYLNFDDEFRKMVHEYGGRR